MKNDLRVTMTRRLLKEGLLRSLLQKPISKITVSDLCKEAGVNRTTFYNHYDTPSMVLKDIAEDYASELKNIYYMAKQEPNDEHALKACLEYLYKKRGEIKILFSENAENSISGFGLDIINERIASQQCLTGKNDSGSHDDHLLYAVLTASAAYGLIKVWLTNEIQKTPDEILNIVKNTTSVLAAGLHVRSDDNS